MKSNTTLINYLKNESKSILTPAVEKAFLSVDRKDFVPIENKCEAYADYPISIGMGQTISQPTTVAFILELLHVKEGFSILDIGCGSGYTTVLLAMLTGEQGFVLGVDIYTELIDFANKNLSHYFFSQANIILDNPS
jgi:protein-L-isoaspartate(D-aspartate) O-methyltransferase